MQNQSSEKGSATISVKHRCMVIEIQCLVKLYASDHYLLISS